MHNISHNYGLLETNLNCQCTLTTPHNTIQPDFPCTNNKDDYYIRHVLPAAWSTKFETSVMSHHSLYSNFSKIFKHDWQAEVPTLNLSSPAVEPYALPIHIEAGSKLSYLSSTTVIITIIAIVILYKKLSVLNPASILGTVMSSLTTRAQAASLSNTAEVSFVFEFLEILLLLSVCILLVLIYLKIKNSATLKLLDTVAWSRGRVKVSLLDDDKPNSTLCVQQGFSNNAIKTPKKINHAKA